MTKFANPFDALPTEIQHNEPYYSGNEFSMNFAYYACEDEFVEEVTELDRLAVEQFDEEKIMAGDYEPIADHLRWDEELYAEDDDYLKRIERHYSEYGWRR